MRLSVTKTKSSSTFYVIKDIKIGTKRSTKTVERLGTYDELTTKLNGKDPYAWAKDYIDELNKLEMRKNSMLSLNILYLKSLK